VFFCSENCVRSFKPYSAHKIENALTASPFVVNKEKDDMDLVKLSNFVVRNSCHIISLAMLQLMQIQRRRTQRLMTRAVSAALHTLNWGPTLSQGPKIPVPSPLSRLEKALVPKLKYEALGINEVKGPFERKVHIHYSCFVPL